MRVALLFACLVAFHAGAEPDAGLADRLREGGYVLYLRHTSTDFSQNDSRMTSFEDCASQRNLTDRGRAEARAIGEHVKRLKIPIGEVLASPFCRTMETARLAFGKATASNDVRGGPVEATRYEPLRKLLSAAVPKGENRVISSHGNPYRALTSSPYLAEGEIAIVQPKGTSFVEVGRIRLEDWAP